MFRPILPLALTFGLAAVVAAQDKKADRPKPDPEGTPLELTLAGKTTTFALDTGGLSAADFKARIEAAGKKGGRPPAPPAVDLTVSIKNTSDKPVTVWAKGDPVVLTLELKGKGAVNIDPPLAFTQEFRIPEPVEIAAGKAHDIPITSLVSGHRMASHFSYWTEPGEYELVATLKTGVNPAPKGAKEADDGFGLVKLTSPPLKLTVEAKK
jgi:hypothetical protein